MSGYTIGCDEVGRGSWAGPVWVCAVLARTEWKVEELDDSKKLCRNQKKIQRVYERVVGQVPFIRYFDTVRSNVEIDRFGIGECLKDMFVEVIQQCLAIEPTAEAILDGTMRLPGIRHISLPQADGLIPAVMAASVIAKTHRDRFMREIAHPLHPEYDWEHNVGYGGAPKHKEALEKYGPTPLHRMTFKPMCDMVRK